MKKFLFGLLLSLAIIGQANAQLYGYLAPTNPTNPTGTASTSGVALGIAVTGAGGGCFVPVQKTGVVLFIVNYTASNGTAADGFTGQIAYGPQSTAPANGAAIPASWTTLGIATGASNGGTTQENQTIVAVARNIPLGQLTGFDVKFAAVTGGTATPVNIICQAMELAN